MHIYLINPYGYIGWIIKLKYFTFVNFTLHLSKFALDASKALMFNMQQQQRCDMGAFGNILEKGLSSTILDQRQDSFR